MQTLYTLLLACSLTVPASAQVLDLPQGFEPAWRKVTRRLHERVADQGIVGSSLAFVWRGKPVARWHHGQADLAAKRKVSADTIFHWASITKTLTGIALLQLRDRGKVSLQDPIVRYLPELRRVHNPFGRMEDISLAHLLSHSAGFRNLTWPWGGQEEKRWQPYEPTRWEQVVAMLPYTKIHFEPGSRYGYSNPGIIFLGRVIEIVSGEDYEVYVEKNVLRPLGMRASYFDHTPYHLLKHRSNNYYIKNGRPVANGLDFDTGITVSNGGLNAPVGDMARYLGFLCGAGDEAALAVLKRESLEEMWKPRLKVRGNTSMGLGFFVLREGKRRYIGHTGGQKGFITFIYIHPGSGAGAISAFNTLGPTTRRIQTDLRADLFRNVFPLFPDA